MTDKFQPRDEDVFPESDVEGHKTNQALPSDEDVEGHRTATLTDDEDVEGHRTATLTDDDDVEGHRRPSHRTATRRTTTTSKATGPPP